MSVEQFPMTINVNITEIASGLAYKYQISGPDLELKPINLNFAFLEHDVGKWFYTNLVNLPEAEEIEEVPVSGDD